MQIGEMVTPTGRLVLGAGDLKSEAWLAARRWRDPVDIHPFRSAARSLDLFSLGYRIGSSDVPSILDLEHVDTPAHVYRNKVYDISPEQNENMLIGSLFEETIAMEWARRNHAVIDEIGLVAHADKPWHQSTIDRRVRECPVYPERSRDHAICGLEVKHMDFASASRWHADIPDRIFAQLIHQLYVTGYEHMHYSVKVPGGFRQGIVYAEREQKITKFVVAAVDRFRAEHLIPQIEPAWNTEKADKAIALDNLTFPERVGELDIESVGEVMDYAGIAAEAGAIDKRKKAAATKLRTVAKGAQVLTFAGQRAFWYGEGRRANTDLERLKERWPDAYADCVTETVYPILNIDKAYKQGGKK